MAHHQFNVILRQMVKTGSFRKNPADHFMAHLTAALLIGTLRITVEDLCSYFALLVALDGHWIREFAPPVTKKYRKEDPESLTPKELIQMIKSLRDGSGVIEIAQKGQHQLTVREVDGQENPASFSPFDGVHLDSIGIGI